ncbi:MAG TPA: hypothetical protein VM469_05415 [Pseudoxanthomonas sp.]|jgi:hypothetical protein|nr:hypothetical protein [Pseudoxanthomonas sp.]
MLDPRDLHSYRQVFPLNDGADFGALIVDYRAQRYLDTSSLTYSAEYLVSCRARLVVPNGDPVDISPGGVGSFADYPAALSHWVRFNLQASPFLKAKLRSYSPRSINASVNLDHSSDASSQKSLSRQHTSGSSSSESNSFTVTLGAPSYTHGWESGTSSSQSNTRTSASGTELDDGDSMSIKDWASYARAAADYASVTWIWAQEYPWDVLSFRNEDANKNIVLPGFVAARLFDGQQLFPPSQLSQYGVDFVANASWEVTTPVDNPVVSVLHDLSYVTATHALGKDDKGNVVVVASMNQSANMPCKLTSGKIDLEVLALDAVAHAGGPAAINFQGDQFRVAPVAGAAFSVLSRHNNLLVRGQGFDAGMVADVAKGSAQLQILLKVADERACKLVLKHWKLAGSDPCLLTLVMPDGTRIEKCVDDDEAQGGEDNLLRIELCNTRYSTENYHNYLVPGLNTVLVLVSPADPASTNCQYQILAAAVT